MRGQSEAAHVLDDVLSEYEFPSPEIAFSTSVDGAPAPSFTLDDTSGPESDFCDDDDSDDAFTLDSWDVVLDAARDRDADTVRWQPRVIRAQLLHHAAEAGDVPTLRWLCGNVEQDARVRDAAGATLVHKAVLSGSADALRWSVHDAGLDAAHADRTGVTPLHLAVHTRRGSDLSLLLVLVDEAGVPVDAQDAHGRTALHTAVMRRDVQCARWLVQHAGADPQLAGGKAALTALQMAAELDDAVMLQSLKQLALRPAFWSRLFARAGA